MTDAPLSLQDLAPPPDGPSLLPEIRRANADAGTRIVVLDDDPLGGQCLHDVPVLTSWEPGHLASELRRSAMFLLLTNTRALIRPEAMQRAREVGEALRQAQLAAGMSVTPIWRSDSTLRGHFYWEMQAFDAAFRNVEAAPPVCVFLPYFGEGGRYTLNDTQYVLQDEGLVPAAETEFARDPAFAYTQAQLTCWLEAHSEGRLKARDVASVSLHELREGGPEHVAGRLNGVLPGGALIVNATADSDLEVFVAGLQQVESAGRRFLCSGAAPFVRVRAGMASRPVLTYGEVGLGRPAGGLTIVGSYAGRTIGQLDGVSKALATTVTLGLDRLLRPEAREAEVGRASAEVTRRLAAGDDVVLRTASNYVAAAGAAVGDALAAVIAGVDIRPRYVLVKGGATASRVATEALGVTRAMVLGQLLPGVPVWRLGEECRWPGLPFVIFPGNVGGPESLAEALRLLRGG